MKVLTSLTIALATLLTPALEAAQTVVPVRMYCLSIALRQGIDFYGDTLTFSSTYPGGEDEVIMAVRNPEVTFPDIDAYISNLAIYDDYGGYVSYGTFYMSLPQFTDSNNNKFPDFFEVALPANTTSSSYCSWWDPMYGGFNPSYTATWTRAAGSAVGTCLIELADRYYDMPFRHFFEIMEYKGTLSYTPGTNVVTGTISLTNTATSSKTFSGPIQFRKSSSDHFNSLTNDPGVWLDAGLQSCAFTNHLFLRDAAWPTNYAGYLEFDSDADPNTFQPWSVWVLSINDSNDANGNGIPNFSDDPVPAPPRQPRLTIARSGTDLKLTIAGDLGREHQIQRKSTLTAGAWDTVQTLNLASDPQTITLPAPAGSMFWRVSAQ